MALNRRYLSYLTVISMMFLVQSCAVIKGQSKDPNAYPVAVKIIETDVKTTFIGSGINGFTNTRYIVKDDKGRNSVVMSSTGDFNTGQCVTLWRTTDMKKFPGYPRLSPANSNCSVLQSEPDSKEAYQYMNPDYNGSGYYQWFNLRMDSWLDVSEADLIRTLGVPMGSYRSGISTFLTYSNQHTTTYTQYNYLGHVANSSSATYFCETTFEIRNGLIFDYTWKGNNCR